MDKPPSQTSLPELESPKRRKVLHFWRCFWLTFLVVSLAYAWYCFYVPSNKIPWASSYTSAQHSAVQSEKPLILYFTGTWCVPCRIMKRKFWADEQVAARVSSEFVPIAIDVGSPENADIMARYKVKGPPVTIVTDPQGNALDWRAGGISKPEFLKLLDSSLQRSSAQ